jgi:hypothetical protein
MLDAAAAKHKAAADAAAKEVAAAVQEAASLQSQVGPWAGVEGGRTVVCDPY